MDKRNVNLLLASTALTGLAAASAYAGSSGSFTATVDNFQCAINDVTGAVNGMTSTPAGTVFEIGSNNITVQIPNGSGTALIVTPSLVTGLFTDNQLTSKNSTFNSSTQDVGIQVQVNVTGPGPIKIAPNTTGSVNGGFNTGATCVDPPGGEASCVIYDQRFIQVSSSVFQNIFGCSNTISPILNSAGMTTGFATFFATCFELVESTLSAHAFNFYVEAPGGSYTFDVDAQLFIGKNNTAGAGSVAGCAGPGTVTVEQVKNFNFNTSISF